MKHLVAYVAVDRPGKHDATGAFVPEARAYVDHWGRDNCRVFTVSNIGQGTAASRRWQFGEFCDRLAANCEEFDVFAFFGHGTYYSIQLGYQRQHVGELAGHLSTVLKRRSKVLLYACSTAENDVKDHKIDDFGAASQGGFADKLRDALMTVGVDADVYGHKTAGHTTWNPYWGRFVADCASIGGEWVVRPRSEYWDDWARAIRETELKYEFPFYSRSELDAWLREYSGDVPPMIGDAST